MLQAPLLRSYEVKKMDFIQAANERHSVRQYLDKPIEQGKANALNEYINECNRSGLHLQLVMNEPKAFDSFMAHYGKFSGVQNYIVLVGKKTADTEEQIGYYGAKVMLFAQTLGLNSCWVALTYKKVKTAFVVEKDEKLYSVIALGYGKTQGVAHKSKTAEEVADFGSDSPEWFKSGIQTALLAPTAMNQQKFRFSLNHDGCVSATAGSGFYTKTDLGIAKFFFELGAGAENVKWVK